MPAITRFWRPTTQMYHMAAPGIEVMIGHTMAGIVPAGFQGDVHNALSYINATPTGANILWHLSNSANPTGISPTAMGNSCATNNMNNALNLVAAEILNGNPGVNANLALTNTLGAGMAGRAALATIINATPAWDITRLPDTGPGLRGAIDELRARINRFFLQFWGFHQPDWDDSNEGYFQHQRWFGRRWGRQGRNVGVTAAALNTWFGGAALPAPFNVAATANHIANSTIRVLEANSPSGAGSSSGVRWNTNPLHPLNLVRPPAIGLAHELIHAYYSSRGEQPGVELTPNVDGSMVLFEYKCIGLGPWDENAPSENSIRREWGGLLAHTIPVADALNHKVPPKRIRN